MSTVSKSQNPKRIYTKLKFVISEQTGAIVSFVSQNPLTKQIRGVRKDDPYPKKVCVVDKNLAPYILLNVLYDVTLIPMAEKDGYVVVEANPVEFPATIETTYMRKVAYRVEVKFGHKTIIFDPKDGEKKSVRSFKECVKLLEKRVDIKDIFDVVKEFSDEAYKLIRLYERDGYFYKD